MTIAFVAAFGIVLLVVLACSNMSRIHAEEESCAAQQSPCVDCLRWEECNGVDNECPLCIDESK